MKYKLQIEKLKQLKMDGNLSTANQLEDNGYMSHTAILKPYILDNEFGNTYVRPQDALQAMLEYGKQFRKRADSEEKDNNILREKIEELENYLQRRNIMIEDLDEQITLLKAEIEKKEVAIYQWKGAVNDLESEKQTLTEIADNATARLNDSSDFNIKLHVKNRELRNEIERECKNFGEFIGHNFSTTTHAERWECDNTHELYDIEELYAKYVQHTQAGRV